MSRQLGSLKGSKRDPYRVLEGIHKGLYKGSVGVSGLLGS